MIPLFFAKGKESMGPGLAVRCRPSTDHCLCGLGSSVAIRRLKQEYNCPLPPAVWQFTAEERQPTAPSRGTGSCNSSVSRQGGGAGGSSREAELPFMI